jgi:hypothetical protein
MSVIQEIEAFREAVDQAKRKVRCVSFSLVRPRARALALALALSLSRFSFRSRSLSRARALSVCLSVFFSLFK